MGSITEPRFIQYLVISYVLKSLPFYIYMYVVFSL